MTKLERLTQYRKIKGFKTAKAFARHLKISESQISDIDKREKSATLFLALQQGTDLNLEWLETGVGEMVIHQVVGRGMRVEDPQARGDESELDENTTRPPEAFDIPRPTGKIPIISWAQAGPDGFFEDSFPAGSGFADINRPFDITDPNAYALIINGDSMVPKYEPGDVILVSPNMGVQTGDYAVARLRDGTVAAKRVKAKDGRYILESVNPDYPPIDCKAEDVVFLHRIVWVKQR